MKLFIIFIQLFFISNLDGTIIGYQFPSLSGETLEDKKITIPTDINGKYSLIALAYSQQAEEDLQTWIKPIYNKFINSSAIVDYDMNIYFIPMFTGVNQPTANGAKKRMKENTDKEYFPYVLCYQGELKKYKEALNMTEKEKPYFFILDKNGKIVYTCSGNYTEDKIEAMEDAVE